MKRGKRTRLWKWGAVAGGALLLVVVLLYAFTMPPASEYKFLAGHRAAGLDISTSTFFESGTGRVHRTPVVGNYYALQTDLEDLIRRAEDEIVTSGGGRVLWSDSDPANWVQLMDARGTIIWISNGRYDPEAPALDERQPGWVTVLVAESRRPTLVDRLRMWLQDRGL